MQVACTVLRTSWIALIAGLCLASSSPAAQVVKMSFEISSSSFPADGFIPKKYTCEAADVSPELSWSGAPQGTKSFALIADDPDAPAGTWTHWVLYDLPPNLTNLAENTPKVDELPDGAQQGRNSFKKIGYNGPCPPPGKAHRYFFKLYALDQKLEIKPGASKSELDNAMQGHILAQTQVVGKYQR